MDVELRQYKTKLKIVSPDKELNTKLMSMLKEEHDCFGIDYSELHEECKKCTILAEIGDKRSPLLELCKEFVENRDATLKFADVKVEEEKEGEDMEETKVEVEETKVEETQAEETKVVKKEKKEKKEKKVSGEKNEYKHNTNSQSAYIDGLLKVGSSIEDAEKKLIATWSDYKPGRFKGHIRHLQKDHSVKIEEKDGKFKIV